MTYMLMAHFILFKSILMGTFIYYSHYIPFYFKWFKKNTQHIITIFSGEFMPLQNTVKIACPSGKDFPRYFHLCDLVSVDLCYLMKSGWL